ncbi:MAG: PEP-CTERM sorting domain-containing protein [Acidobacteriia bacterium]|nr:PEP-CTERM sorting domain-containing protein [Terriglobia bacterium]
MRQVPYKTMITIVFLALGAKADTIAYVGASASAFGTIDLNTGAFTLINGNSPTVDGFGALGGSLFASEAFNGVAHGTLFQINPVTGTHTAVGSDTGLYYEDFGSTPTGLYAIGHDPTSRLEPQNLYSINPLTGAATLIGPTGLITGQPYQALSTNSATLYFAQGSDLYTLNTNTGAATVVGPFGGFTAMDALLEEGGILYGGDNYHHAIDTIDPATGTATVGPPSGVFLDNFGLTYGLAPSPLASSVPEPATFGLVGLFVAGIAARRHVLCKRRRAAQL